jgi:hypothetical protein
LPSACSGFWKLAPWLVVLVTAVGGAVIGASVEIAPARAS